MKNLNTIYKKDSKGKIRVIQFYTEGNILIQEAGLYGGKLVPNTKVCKGKNIGKKNKTTPENQARLELMSRIKAKIDSGYFYKIEDAEKKVVIMPMLAKSYDKECHKINWSNGVYLQPKLDGMRCLAIIDKNSNVILKSRDGKEIITVEFIRNSIQEYCVGKKITNIIFDGELYAHGKTFQENMTLIKKYKPGLSESINFHIYDCFRLNEENKEDNFFLRYDNASELLFIQHHNNIEKVQSIEVTILEELVTIHAKNLADGYEGTMIRHGNEGYKVGGRSSSLLKYKDFQDLACEIIDIETGKQKTEWGVPRCKMPDSDKTFRTGIRMSHEERIDMLKNKKDWIGKTAEVRYFELTDEGLPRFGVMVGIRLDK